MTEHPTHPFGDTSPCLNIARKHGVDYMLPLVVTDVMVHNRYQGILSAMAFIGPVPDAVFEAVHADCVLVAARTKSMHAAAPK